jgi:hypothetical protein
MRTYIAAGRETFTFASQVDHAPIFVRKWLPPCGIRPRATMQITHGIAEHSGRYDRVARFLAAEGLRRVHPRPSRARRNGRSRQPRTGGPDRVGGHDCRYQTAGRNRSGRPASRGRRNQRGARRARNGRLMKMLNRTALALAGGAAALVLAGLVVLAVVVVVVLLFAAISPPPTSARVTPAPPAPAAVAGPLDAAAPGGIGVHIASLTGCIAA